MLETKYDFKKVEEGKYSKWLEKEIFRSGNLEKEPFCIVIPPPNVTGKLHLGHAWDTTLQDIMIRYKKLDGFDTLWLPGMDHAAISTEAKVVAKLKQEGINKYDLGREGFLKEAWAWKEEYASNIREQWAKLGLSLDYSKERFTLDEGLNKAVTKVFCDLYQKGLIYRGEKIINWDPVAKTALSNEEVIYKEVAGAFYHIKYYIEGTTEFLEVATTRPETLFGDTAVAVNPKDDRYKNLIGKNVILPIVNKLIPIIGDEHADMEFGTGVVKITPAHDPNDFEVGERHNLERIKCLNEDGTMNQNALKYNGLDRFVARKKLVEELEKEELLIKVEEITHSVGHSERTDAMVEPYLSLQWFVKMESLANQVLEIQKNKEEKVNFVPERFEKILNHWMQDCHDWCISRQLWWGHRIPAWYKDNQVYVGTTPPEGEGWHQDEDVLDTWFSSALWPFSTLGWPEQTNDFKRYFPTNVLVTGYDIIFFWVARMIFTSLEFTNKSPFKYCLIHGLIRDKQGRKMSKSLSNGVDPMDVIDTYGTDSLRFFLSTTSSPGSDLRYDEEKVKSTWNFINKIWNASRFVIMNLDGKEEQNFENLKEEDKWILNKLNLTIKNVRKHMEKLEFNVVGATLYDFIWSDFCDSYIELSKTSLSSLTTKSVLKYTLDSILKMLHPFMPYVTEELYSKLNNTQESILLSEYPKVKKEFEFQTDIDNVIEDIKEIRNLKQVNSLNKETLLSFEANKIYKTIYISQLKIRDEYIITTQDLKQYTPLNYSSNNINITYYIKENIDKEALLEEIEKLKISIKRRETLLSNQGYITKAPKELVEKEKHTLEEEKQELEKLNLKLN